MKLQSRSVAVLAALLLALLAVHPAHADPRTALNILAKAAGLDWPTTGDGCKLEGVSCDGEDVSSIQIGDKDLKGTLPDGIWAEFPKLSYFTAAGNELTGPVPSFAGATSLATIDLQNNQLSGPLPPGLASLTALKYVNLRGNAAVCGAKGYQKPTSLNIDLEASAANACDGSAPSPDDSAASPSPDATASPDATDSPAPSKSPAATKSPATPTASPASVTIPSPAPPAALASPECICAASFTSTRCKTAMDTYCGSSGANTDACTQFKAAATGTDEDSAAGFATFLIGRCFAASFQAPATGYCTCGAQPTSAECSQATLQICSQKVQVQAAGATKARSLCLDLIQASLGNSAAVVNVAALLSQNCTSEITPTKEGAQLTMVLNGIDKNTFALVYQSAFKQVLADIVGGSPNDVQILKVQELPGANVSRRLLQDGKPAVQVTTFVPGPPTELIDKLTKSLNTGDFVSRMQAQQINVQPLQNSVGITAYRADPTATAAPAPAKKKKSASKVPIYAGVAAGVIVLLALCVVLTLFLFKRRRNRRFEQTLPMAKTWLEPNTEDLKPTPSAPMPPAHSAGPPGRSPSYTVPPKPTTNHPGAYDATPVPLSVRTTNPPRPDSPEVVVASDSPKATTTSARNRFWRQASTTSEPATAPLAPQPNSSVTSQVPASRFASLPPVGSTHSAAAAAVAAEASAAGGSTTSKQAQQAERRKFWQQFELSWQANKSKPPAITTNAPKVEDDDDIPSSGTSWTSDHTTTPTGRAPQRSTYQNPFVNPKK